METWWIFAVLAVTLWVALRECLLYMSHDIRERAKKRNETEVEDDIV
jgi:sensor domain CHASE-containing protein